MDHLLIADFAGHISHNNSGEVHGSGPGRDVSYMLRTARHLVLPADATPQSSLMTLLSSAPARIPRRASFNISTGIAGSGFRLSNASEARLRPHVSVRVRAQAHRLNHSDVRMPQ
jgi:hypothetical protein